MEEVYGKEKIDRLRYEIYCSKKLIQMHKDRINKLKDNSFLYGQISQEDRIRLIKESKNDIKTDEWLIGIMERELTELLSVFPEC